MRRPRLRDGDLVVDPERIWMEEAGEVGMVVGRWPLSNDSQKPYWQVQSWTPGRDVEWHLRLGFSWPYERQELRLATPAEIVDFAYRWLLWELTR